MSNPRLEPHEIAAAEKVREPHRANQPYASELDDRELERAHKEDRPVSPSSDSSAPKHPTAQADRRRARRQ